MREAHHPKHDHLARTPHEREAVDSRAAPYDTAMQAAYDANKAKVDAMQVGAQRIAAGLSYGVRRPAGGPAELPDAPPTALAVHIAGTPTTGSNLTGEYTFFDPNGDAEGASTFAWLRDGAAIAGATGKVYALIGGDEGHQIAFRVTPVAATAPTTGAAVTSPPVTAMPAI
jgi:hypothetical protein